MTRYKFLALDVDGTLVGPDSLVGPDVADALGRAHQAGLRVCLATGRSYIETIGVWRQLRLTPPYEPMILIGGALVSEPDTGRTLYHKPIEPTVAQEFAEALGRAGLAAMAIVDAWRHGWDYLLVEGPDPRQAQAGWFSKMNVKVQPVERLDRPGLPAPLRISAVVQPRQGEPLAAELSRRFGGRLNVHSILAPNYGVTIVEAFARAAGKHTALTYVAQACRIALRDIVAVGDDINDLAMIRGAGLGVAMPQSRPAMRKAAAHVIEGGLARFIDEMLAGRFD
jgi:hypothetical protein